MSVAEYADTYGIHHWQILLMFDNFFDFLELSAKLWVYLVLSEEI